MKFQLCKLQKCGQKVKSDNVPFYMLLAHIPTKFYVHTRLDQGFVLGSPPPHQNLKTYDVIAMISHIIHNIASNTSSRPVLW